MTCQSPHPPLGFHIQLQVNDPAALVTAYQTLHAM